MEITHVKAIREAGEYDTRRIRPWAYAKQRTAFWQNHGIILPTKAEAKQLGRLQDLRVVLSPITITIELKGGEWLQYKFHKGWVTDLASVPWWFRGLVDNDDIYLLAAAYCHDANFSCHYLGDTLAGLDRTNDLFREMIRYRGKKVRAWLAHAAVDSIVGHALWHKMPDRRAKWTEGFVEFAASNPMYKQKIGG